MAGHHFSTLSIPRRILRVLGPIAAAVALLALPSQAWGVYNFTVSNNTFPSSGTPPAVGNSLQQTVIVTLNAGSGSVAIKSIVLQSAGATVAGVAEYKLGTIDGCAVDSTGATTNPSGTACNIHLTFTPAFPGSLASPLLSRNATLVLTDGNSTTWTFALSGAATGPLTQMVPGTLTRYAGQAYAGPGFGTLNPLENGLGATAAGYGGDGGPATSAQFHFPTNGYSLPQQMAFDSAGNLYMVDAYNYIIRKIDNTSNHNVTTIAGTPQTSGYSGDNGPATSAKLTYPIAMTLDAAGDIYFLDSTYPGFADQTASVRLRRIDAVTGIITSVAGQNFNYPTYNSAGGGTCTLSGTGLYTCGDGGLASYADLYGASNIAIDPTGNIYFWSLEANSIREITASNGKINTIASAAAFGLPTDGSCSYSGRPGMTLAADGNLYVVSANCAIGSSVPRFITEYNLTTNPGQITNVASETYQSNYCAPTSAQGGFPAADLNLGFGPGQSGALSSDASGNLYIPAVMEISGCAGISNPAFIYRINLSTSTAYLMEYNYGGSGTVTDTSIAFNAFSGYYVSPIEVIPDASGNLYAMSLNQIAEISGSNAALYYPTSAVSQADYTTSADQIVTYANVGNASATVPTLDFASTGGSPGTNFSLDPSPTIPTPEGNSADCTTASSVAVNAACMLYLQFTPTQVGMLSDTLNLGSPADQTVSLIGNAKAAPQIGVSPSSLSFGNQTENTSAIQYMTILSMGTATLTVNQITSGGKNASNFVVAVGGTNPCTFSGFNMITLTAGSSCTLQVTFTPTAVASYSAYLSGAANATSSSSALLSLSAGQLIPFTGAGIAAAATPIATLLPAPLGFPSTAAGATAQMTTTLSQTAAGATLNISGITITGANASNFAIDSSSSCNGAASLAGVSSCNIMVDFKPTSAASYTATLSVADNAPESPQTATLNGTGTASGAPAVSLSPSPLIIPTTYPTGTEPFVTLTNAGSAPLSFAATNPFTYSGAYASFFSFDPGGGGNCWQDIPPRGNTTVAAGSNCNLVVNYDYNQVAGVLSANLTVADNAANSPQAVRVNAIGQAGQLQFFPALLNPYAGLIGSGNGCQDSGNGGPAVNALLCHAESTVADLNGNVYIADQNTNVVRKVDSSGNISDFAGNASETGASGPGCAQQTDTLGDGCPAIDATIGFPGGVAVDGLGNVYIADTGNKAVRVVNAQTGIITTFLGATNGSLAFGSNTVNFIPGGMSFDPSGNLYVTDYIAEVVLKVDPSGNYTVFAGVLTQQGFNGDSQPAASAELYWPTGVAADLYGNVYIADSQNNRIRKVDTKGNITTVAGNGTAGNTGDGGSATSAEIYAGGVAVDAAGEFYFSTDGTSIRKVDLLGNISTIAGGGTGGTGSPAPSASLFDAVNPGIDMAGDVLIPSDSGVAKVGPQGDLVFGTQNVGSTSAPLTVTVTNTGNAPVYFYYPNESDIGPVYSITGDFAIASGGSCVLTTSGTIAAGASCTINVTFSPTQIGSRTGSITINAVAPNYPIPAVIQLSGTGTQAQQPTMATPQIMPATGTYSNYQSVTITDATSNAVICYTTVSGSTPTAANGICTSGTTYTGSFSMGAGLSIQAIATLAGSTNSSLASATYTLEAAPPTLTPPGGTYAGAQSVTLSTTTTGAQIFYTIDGSTPTGMAPSILYGGTPISVTKSGTVINAITVDDGMQNSTVSTGTYTLQAPAVTLVPPSLSFGNQTAGTTSASQSTVLTNSGTGPLTITAVALTGTNPADFTESDNCVSASPLAANGSCTITVKFAPASTASYSASISITDNASNSPQTVPLTGTGTAAAAPIASLTAPAAFPSTTVGVTSAALSATLSNTGNAALAISGVTITGANPTDFAVVTGSNACGSSLAAGASCSIYVTFTPASAASFAATLSVADNAAGSPQTAALSGAGAAAVVPTYKVASPTAPQTVLPGAAATYTINVTPVNGSFTGLVTLGASGLPAGATAAFAPPTVTPGSTGATSQLTVQTAAAVAAITKRPSPWPLALPALSLIGLCFVPGKRYRRWITLGLLLVCSLGAITALSGCGGGFGLGNLTPPPASYTITVTGTSGSSVQTTTVQLTVQ